MQVYRQERARQGCKATARIRNYVSTEDLKTMAVKTSAIWDGEAM
jgi:hypothetical protein